MIKEKTVIAIIPARGGSKGIPGKNIKLIGGKPLIAWTIDSAIVSKYIDRVIVSTDSDEIASVSKNYGAEIPFKRPAKLATDEASSESVVLHALRWIKKNEGKEYDYFILLQPPLPLRTTKHIDGAIEKIVNDPIAKTLLSITKATTNPYLIEIINKKGYLEDFIERQERIVRRQDIPSIYQINGAIYLIKSKDFLEKKSFYISPMSYYLMSRRSSVDLDDNFDFTLAEFLISVYP